MRMPQRCSSPAVSSRIRPLDSASVSMSSAFASSGADGAAGIRLGGAVAGATAPDHRRGRADPLDLRWALAIYVQACLLLWLVAGLQALFAGDMI